MVKKCLICGYIIKDTSMEINKAGILNRNSKDNIITCPFCGVSEEFLVDEDYILKNLSGDLDEKTLRIIENAMKLEVFNGDFYKKAANMAMKQEIKNKFLALASIEYTHANVHRNLGGFKQLPKLKDLDYSRLSSDELLLEEAKKREMHAIYYYNRYYNEVCKDEIRRFFDALKEVESEHIIIIEQ